LFCGLLGFNQSARNGLIIIFISPYRATLHFTNALIISTVCYFCVSSFAYISGDK